MPSVVLRTVDAYPNVLVIDFVVVLGGDFNAASIDGVVLKSLFAFQTPLLEARSVRVVVDFGDHVVGQMAVLVREGVDQPVFTVDDTFR